MLKNKINGPKTYNIMTLCMEKNIRTVDCDSRFWNYGFRLKSRNIYTSDSRRNPEGTIDKGDDNSFRVYSVESLSQESYRDLPAKPHLLEALHRECLVPPANKL